jgi:hypothetical protein
MPDLDCTVKKPDSEDCNTRELVFFVKNMKEKTDAFDIEAGVELPSACCTALPFYVFSAVSLSNHS